MKTSELTVEDYMFQVLDDLKKWSTETTLWPYAFPRARREFVMPIAKRHEAMNNIARIEACILKGVVMDYDTLWRMHDAAALR